MCGALSWGWDCSNCVYRLISRCVILRFLKVKKWAQEWCKLDDKIGRPRHPFFPWRHWLKPICWSVSFVRNSENSWEALHPRWVQKATLTIVSPTGSVQQKSGENSQLFNSPWRWKEESGLQLQYSVFSGAYWFLSCLNLRLTGKGVVLGSNENKGDGSEPSLGNSLFL